MSYNDYLTYSYINSALTEAEVENAISYNISLSVVKFDILTQDSSEVKELIKFIYVYLDFKPIIHEHQYSYVVYLQNSRLHTSVLTIKNLIMSLKLKFNKEISNIAITELSMDETIDDLLERLNKFYIKSKLSKNIYYGTKDLDHNSTDFDNIQRVLQKNSAIDIYGFFQNSPIKIEANIVEYNDYKRVIKAQEEFIKFLYEQKILYIEHRDIPDIISVEPTDIHSEYGTIEVSKFKFVNHSPLHRKESRVVPHTTTNVKLKYEDFEFDGILADISKNSILLSTHIENVEKIKKNNLEDRSFDLSFILDSFDDGEHNIDVKASIFRITGNQLVLNLHTTSEVKSIIANYINLCYQKLLLELQS
jgi:hypothetical protein